MAWILKSKFGFLRRFMKNRRKVAYSEISDTQSSVGSPALELSMMQLRDVILSS